MPRQPSTGFPAAATRLCAVTLCLAAPLSAHAANVVGGSGRFATIQSAIDALPAGGGEVDVMPGSYHEQVIISKPNVRLIGMGQIAAATKLWNDRWAQMPGSNGRQRWLAADLGQVKPCRSRCGPVPGAGPDKA
ncbi:MAG TPA: hypothetical protein VF798_17015 [Burkholderiaceae bacterium]